jgi:hypothetical protein
MRHRSWHAAALLLGFLLLPSAECQQKQGAAAPAQKVNQPPRPRIKIEAGELAVLNAQESDRFPIGCTDSSPDGCYKAEDGSKLLIVWLKSVDPAKAQEVGLFVGRHYKNVFLLSEGGSKTEATLGGLIDRKIFVGFTPPKADHGFKLSWPGNPDIALGK